MSYRSARKVSSYLVRAKLYPLERRVGSEKSGKSGCQVCLNIQENDTFTSTTTGESYKINHKPNCDDSCLIYLLTSKCCGKQYVGKPLINSDLHGTITKTIMGKMHGKKHACKKICFSNLKAKVIVVSSEMFP